MTIDLCDDVLMPAMIGVVLFMVFALDGFLIYLLLNETLIATIFILSILMAWAVGFLSILIHRRLKYG